VSKGDEQGGGSLAVADWYIESVESSSRGGKPHWTEKTISAARGAACQPQEKGKNLEKPARPGSVARRTGGPSRTKSRGGGVPKKHSGGREGKGEEWKRKRQLHAWFQCALSEEETCRQPIWLFGAECRVRNSQRTVRCFAKGRETGPQLINLAEASIGKKECNKVRMGILAPRGRIPWPLEGNGSLSG